MARKHIKKRKLAIIIFLLFASLGALLSSCSNILLNNRGFYSKNDTTYFVRKNFVYCDSLQPYSCKYKNNRFYETDKDNVKGEDKLNGLSDYFESPAYCVFITKKGQKIEEGGYAGIWEVTFSQGMYKSYYPNGSLFRTGNYKDTRKVGKWVHYDREGNISKEEIYDEGKLVETKKY